MKNLKKSLGIFTGTLAMALSAQIFAADAPETISVTSSVIDHHGTIPLEYSAYGDNTSIDLNWSNLPAGTVQLALILDDPKVVELGMMPTPFVHWVVYNIPASASGLPGGMAGDAELSVNGMNIVNGVNGTRRTGYFGPRPPANGELHSYHFRVYALDADLGLEAGLGKDQLLEAADGHILATGMLMGHYEHKE